jgi:hypothetical protein
MTSSSSLYGTVTTQNSSSTNSTSLYGEAGTPIPDSSGNVVVRGDLIVLSGNILTTATTGNIFPANATTINLGLAATTLNIGAATGSTTINNTLFAPGADFGNITIGVADDQTITTTSGELRLSSVSNAIKLVGTTSLYTDNTGTFNLLNQPTTVFAFRNATTLELGEDTGTTGINNNLRIDGTSINLAQATNFLYSGAGNRLNRPTIQSTTGNQSGLRVAAPNTGTSAQALFSVTNSSDINNAEFLQMGSRGSALTDTFRFLTGKYTGGVQGPANKSIAFTDDTNTYATVNPAGPTIGTDLTTKTYVDGLSGTTYTQNISSTTGGANLNLVGSDSTTDTVKFANGTGVAVSYTDASTATIAIGQAVAVTDAVAFASVATPALNSGGGSALTVTGGAVNPSIITVDGGETTVALNGGLGGDTAQLTLSSGFLEWAHTAGMMGSVSGTWGLNPNGTTSFPSFTFPYADGSSNQVLRTNGSGILAWYTPADLNTTYTIASGAVTGGANLTLSGSDASTDSVAYKGAGATTVTSTDANTITITSTDTNTTYTQDASATTGGANLNLVSSAAVTDTIKFAGGTNVTITATDANTITIDAPVGPNTTYTIASNTVTGGANLTLSGSDSTTDNVAYKGAGATTVTSTDANTITITSVDTNTTYTQNASSVTGGAGLNLVGSDSTTDTVSFKGAGATTVTRTDADTVTVTSTDTNTTYTYGAAATTGGANLTLTGSDATTNTVKVTSGTGVTVSDISATEISVAIGQAVATTDSVTFNQVNATKALVGTTANFTDWPNAQFVASQADGGDSHIYNMGVVGEGVATLNDDTRWGVGVYGNGFTNGSARSSGILGDGSVTASGDTGAAVGVRGYATDTHAGGPNIGLYGNASGGLTNYALYMVDGNMWSGTAQSWSLPDNNASALSIDATNSTAGLIKVVTTTGAKGVTMAGKLDVAGITTVPDASRVLGSLNAMYNPTGYTFPPTTINSISGNAGFDIVSSTGGTMGYSASCSLTNYYADTQAGTNTSPAIQMRSANGTGTAPTATLINNVMGSTNYGAYGTTDWSSYVASQGQGGGLNALHPLQAQAYSTGTVTDAIATLTPTVVARTQATVASVAITSTNGFFSCTATTIGVGNSVVITGTNSGSGTITGYVSGNIYYVIGGNASTTFQLSATPGGTPIVTTAGTTTGLTFVRYLITVTFATQTIAPYGLNAKIAVSGITGVTDGTYMAISSTTSQVLLGTYTTAVSLGATPLLSIRNVTNAGTGYRVRGFAANTVMNSVNRINFTDHTAAVATYKSDIIAQQSVTPATFVLGTSSISGTTLTVGTLTSGTIAAGSFLTGTGITANTFIVSNLAGSGAGSTWVVSATQTVASTTITGSKQNLITSNVGLTYDRTYGSFYSSATQTNPVSNAENLMIFGSTDIAQGVSIVTNGTTLTRITIARAGVYNIQFSAQLSQTAGGADNAFIWLKKNGTAITATAGDTRVAGNGDRIMASWNYLVSAVVPGDYYELAWTASGTSVVLEAIAAAGVVPSIPSVILTVVPVGA